MSRFSQSTVITITAAGLLLAGFPGLAQTPEELETVTVTGKAGDLLGQTTAASSGYASSEDLLSRPVLRRGEILETIPGVIITQHAGGGKANQYFLRGFNLDHGTDFATSLEGVPLNLRTHAHGQGYTDLNSLIPELLSGVTYTKGNYAAANGDLSTAGSADFTFFNTLPDNPPPLSLAKTTTTAASSPAPSTLASQLPPLPPLPFSPPPKTPKPPSSPNRTPRLFHLRPGIQHLRRLLDPTRRLRTLERPAALVPWRRRQPPFRHLHGLPRHLAIQRPDPQTRHRQRRPLPSRPCRPHHRR